jgi:hypothetical protein
MYVTKRTIFYDKLSSTNPGAVRSRRSFPPGYDSYYGGPSDSPSYASDGPSGRPYDAYDDVGPYVGPLIPTVNYLKIPPITRPITKRNVVHAIKIADVEVVKGKWVDYLHAFQLFKTTMFSRKIGNMTDPINAEANVLITVPDSVASLYLVAVSMNDVYGMGLTEEYTTLEVF